MDILKILDLYKKAIVLYCYVQAPGFFISEESIR